MRAAKSDLTDATERLVPGLDDCARPAPDVGGRPLDLDGFLASVERRAFRLAQLALGQREDALDAVQDAMLKLLSYRDRPAGEWPLLFWSILRRVLTDRHRRDAVKRRLLGWLGRSDPAGEDLLRRRRRRRPRQP